MLCFVVVWRGGVGSYEMSFGCWGIDIPHPCPPAFPKQKYYVNYPGLRWSALYVNLEQKFTFICNQFVTNCFHIVTEQIFDSTCRVCIALSVKYFPLTVVSSKFTLQRCKGFDLDSRNGKRKCELFSFNKIVKCSISYNSVTLL